MAKRTTQEATEQHPVEQQCSHHWMIEGVAGPTSAGVCKLCGERKEFRNELRKRSTTAETGAPEAEADSKRKAYGNGQDPRIETLIRAATQESTLDEWLAAVGRLGNHGASGLRVETRPPRKNKA